MDRASHDLQSRAENNMKVLGSIGFALTFAFVAVVIGGAVVIMYKRMLIDQINDML